MKKMQFLALSLVMGSTCAFAVQGVQHQGISGQWDGYATLSSSQSFVVSQRSCHFFYKVDFKNTSGINGGTALVNREAVSNGFSNGNCTSVTYNTPYTVNSAGNVVLNLWSSNSGRVVLGQRTPLELQSTGQVVISIPLIPLKKSHYSIDLFKQA